MKRISYFASKDRDSVLRFTRYERRRAVSQCGDLWRYLRRRRKHYNRRGARHHGALLIHVERKRMFTAISTLAHSIAPAAHRLKPLRVHVRTIIYDNSKEFAGHRQIARILHPQAFFATPYHAGEHGGTENANGLIRNDFSRSGKSRGIRHFKNNARK